MADEPIAIVIQDGVDAAIAQKIIAIGVASRDSAASVDSLKASLAAINSSGLSGLKAEIDNVTSSTTKLQQTLGQNSVAAKDLTSSTQLLSSAQRAYKGTTAEISAISLQLIEARRALRTETKMLSDTENSLGKSASMGSLQAKAAVDGAKQRWLAANETVLSLQRERAELSRLAQQQTKNVVVQNELNTAHSAGITPVMAASAAIRGLEGNFGTSVRAGERFLVTTLGLGKVLQFAFPVFGALALLGILDILSEHVTKLITAFHNLSMEARLAAVNAIEAGNKIIKMKEEGFFTATNFSKFLIGDVYSAGTIEVTQAREALKELEYKRELAVAQAELNEKGLTGLKLQEQKTRDIQLEIDFVKQQKKAADDLAQSYKNQLTATHKVPIDVGGTSVQFEDVPNITDEKQVKALSDNMEIAKEAGKELTHQIDMLGVKLQGSMLKEPLAGMKDELKAAREQMRLFEKEFGELKSNLAKQGKTITPQDEQSLFANQLKRALPENVDALTLRKGTADQAVARQSEIVEVLTQKLRDQKDTIGEYSDALRAKREMDKVDLDLQKQHIVITDQQRDELKGLIKYTSEHVDYQRELRKVYDEFAGPLRTYTAAQEAIGKLEKDGAITHNQALIALNESKRAYTDSKQPLAEYAHGLDNQVVLLGKYGVALTVATEVQRVQEQLRLRGRALTDQETTSLRNYLTQLEQQKTIQSFVNQLYNQNQGAVENLTLRQLALTKALKDQIITQQQYNREILKTKIEAADLRLEMGKATSKDVTTSVFGNYIKDFKGFTSEVTKLYKDMFAQIADGAADSLGRAIAYGEDLGAALKDVARQAIAELISGMIKLGIRMLINHFLGATLAKAAMAETIALASAAAAAWAPAAALASLASFGTNAGPADAALSSTVALATILAQVGSKFATGGYVNGPGSATSDSILARLSNGEFVVNSRATSENRSTLEMMNRGAKVVNAATSVGNFSGKVEIKVEHDGSTNVQVEHVSENKVRIIAKQEAQKAVEQHAPTAIATELNDPNSRVSKSMQRNVAAPRKR